MAKYIPRNSPEAFEIARRVGEEDRRIHNRKVPEKKEKVYKPSTEWKPRVKVTDEIRDEILRLAKQGLSERKIAAATGVSKITAEHHTMKDGSGQFQDSSK